MDRESDASLREEGKVGEANCLGEIDEQRLSVAAFGESKWIWEATALDHVSRG